MQPVEPPESAAEQAIRSIKRRPIRSPLAAVVATSEGPGLGSEFTVRLPAAVPDANSSALPARPSGPQQARGGGTRVLIVDDHRDVADGLTRLLRFHGYDARAVLNPVDALAAAKAFRPQVALLDIGLPTMDGYTLAEELRAHLGDMTPVLIALSGYDQPQDRRRSQASGFATHLAKPVDADVLVNALRELTAVS